MACLCNLHWLIVVLLLLYAVWLGARSLNVDAIWLDEYYSIFESGGAQYGPLSPLDIALRVAGYAVWPPGYNYFLAGWGVLVGWTPLAARVLSWLLGLLAIAVIYRLARELMPQKRQFALFATVFISGSAFYLYYFHELRGYSFHVLFGLIATMLYWRLIRRADRWPAQIGFAAALVLLLYSHPVGQLWFAMLAGFHIAFEWRNSQWKRVLFLFLVAVLFYAPWLAFMLIKTAQAVSIPGAIDTPLILGAAAAAFSNWLTIPTAILGILSLRLIRQRSIQFLWWWLIGLVALTLLVNRIIPFLFHIRHLIAVLPALMLLAAAGLIQLQRFRWLQAAICAVWLIMGVYLSFHPTFASDLPGALRMISRPGFEAALQALAQNADPDDAVIFRLADQDVEYLYAPPLDYYLEGSPLHFSLLSMVNARDDVLIDDRSFTEIPFEQRLQAFVGESPRLWVAEIPGLVADSQMETLRALIADSYQPCAMVVDMPDMRVELYAQDGQCMSWLSNNARF